MIGVRIGVMMVPVIVAAMMVMVMAVVMRVGMPMVGVPGAVAMIVASK